MTSDSQSESGGVVSSTAWLADGLMEIVKLADHCIPFYAYGDNEAACDMSHRLEQVTKLAEAMRDRIMDDESANSVLSDSRVAIPPQIQ